MSPKNLNSLFTSARREAAPAPPPDFAARVLTTVRREAQSPAAPLSLLDQLDRLVPRLALAAAALIVLCVAAELTLHAAGANDFSEDLALASEQWLFAAQ